MKNVSRNSIAFETKYNHSPVTTLKIKENLMRKIKDALIKKTTNFHFTLRIRYV